MENENFIHRYRKLLLSIGIAVFSTAVMALSLLSLSYFVTQEETPNLVWILMTVCLFCAAIRQGLFYFREKDQKLKIFRLSHAGLMMILGIVSCFFIRNFIILQVESLTVMASLTAYNVVKLISKLKLRNIIVSGLFIGICGCILIDGIITFIQGDYVNNYIAVCAILASVSFVSILREAFSKIKFATVKNIFEKTFAAEILLGLVFLIVSFSFVFMAVEGMSYGDALWLSFSITTTIGFGDVVVKSLIGRIIAVILGIYGIVVVALITSIIVNFYNDIKVPSKEKAQEKEPKNKDEENK